MRWYIINLANSPNGTRTYNLKKCDALPTELSGDRVLILRYINLLYLGTGCVCVCLGEGGGTPHMNGPKEKSSCAYTVPPPPPPPGSTRPNLGRGPGVLGTKPKQNDTQSAKIIS